MQWILDHIPTPWESPGVFPSRDDEAAQLERRRDRAKRLLDARIQSIIQERYRSQGNRGMGG